LKSPGQHPRFTLANLWRSSTLMTWCSFVVRAGGALIVLPLVLRHFNPPEVVVWLLFSSIVSLQLMVDIGFSPTFTRVIAFGMAGATELHDVRSSSFKVNSDGPNWELIERICATMRFIYARLTIVSIILLATAGTLALLKPIGAVPEAVNAWLAWAVVLISSAVVLYGNQYSAYLQGLNQVALAQRIQAVTGLGGMVSAAIILLAGGGLLGVVLGMQVWQVIGVLVSARYGQRVEHGRLGGFNLKRADPAVLKVVWPSAWRSGLGVLMSAGLLQLTNMLYAQLGSSQLVASYLMSLRMIQTISQFSQAPFYSKLPLLARLLAEGRGADQIRLAASGMRRAYWAFVIPFLLAGELGQPLLKLIGSHVEFVNPLLWGLLGIAIMGERFGAMHLQLYSTTNHILWHVANGGQGLLFLASMLVLYPLIGLYALPIGMLTGYWGFYGWYSASLSYGRFGQRFWAFEYTVFLPPLAVVVLYILGSFLAHRALSDVTHAI